VKDQWGVPDYLVRVSAEAHRCRGGRLVAYVADDSSEDEYQACLDSEEEYSCFDEDPAC
jgi:hypothetical protein